MKIGDKVRALREDIEGVVTKFLPNDLVEVEIEDGFEIPIQRSELVIVSSSESEYFEEESTEVSSKVARKVDTIEKGLLLVFDPFHGDKLVKLNVYNSTPHPVSVIAYDKSNTGFDFQDQGWMKPNIFGTKVAVAGVAVGQKKHNILLDFNKSTGVLSNTVDLGEGGYSYGIEFSPSGPF